MFSDVKTKSRRKPHNFKGNEEHHLVRAGILEVSDTKSLSEFAGVVERKLAKAKNPTSAANIVCRLMTSRDERIAALMTCKWVEWRYGKPKDNAENGTRNFAINIVNHIPRPGDLGSEAIASEDRAQSTRESSETSEAKIIQAEPKSKQ